MDVTEPLAFDYATERVGQSRIVHADCLEWLSRVAENTPHAVVTDPPYGVKEYDLDQLEKRANGKGGIWRIPPSFGSRPAPCKSRCTGSRFVGRDAETAIVSPISHGIRRRCHLPEPAVLVLLLSLVMAPRFSLCRRDHKERHHGGTEDTEGGTIGRNSDSAFATC